MIRPEHRVQKPAHEAFASAAGVSKRWRGRHKAEQCCEKPDYSAPHAGHYSPHKSLQHPGSEMPVTITAVDAFRLRIPHDMWAEPPLFAGRPRTHVEAVYVRVATDK